MQKKLYSMYNQNKEKILFTKEEVHEIYWRGFKEGLENRITKEYKEK